MVVALKVDVICIMFRKTVVAVNRRYLVGKSRISRLDVVSL